jgi:hypothetical protein
MRMFYFILVFAALAAGCARPPVQEIAAAQSAIEAAVKAGAEDYADQDLRAARDTLAVANTQVEAKDYKAAKLSALDAKAKAEAAAVGVEAGRVRLKTGVETKLAAAQPVLDEINGLLAKAKGNKIAPLKQEAAELKGELDAARAAYDAGTYKTAMVKCQPLDSLLSSLKERVDEAGKKGRKGK